MHRTAAGNGVLACVGLDRFLRLFDLRTRASIGNVYCKTKMTSVLIVEGSLQSRLGSAKRRKSVDFEAQTAEDNEDESDSLWAMLPEISTNGNSNTKRRRLVAQEARVNVL